MLLFIDTRCKTKPIVKSIETLTKPIRLFSQKPVSTNTQNNSFNEVDLYNDSISGYTVADIHHCEIDDNMNNLDNLSTNQLIILADELIQNNHSTSTDYLDNFSDSELLNFADDAIDGVAANNFNKFDNFVTSHPVDKPDDFIESCDFSLRGNLDSYSHDRGHDIEC